MASTVIERVERNRYSNLTLISETKELVLELLDDRDIAVIVERITGETNLLIASWNLEPHSKMGGFMGCYYLLTINVNRHGIQDTFNLFAKIPPQSGPQLDFLTHARLFKKEVTMYDTIIPKMGNSKGLEWAANCYLCKPDVIMVMEDLSKQGYTTLNKFVSFDFNELTCLFKTFAKFHSRSIILDEHLRVQGKSILDMWGDQLNEGLFTNTTKSLKYQQSALIGLRVLTENIEELQDHQRNNILEKVEKWWQHPIQALQPSKKYKNVICHRDVWSSNFMFKIDAHGKAIDCRLIDFQYYSFLNPAMDIVLALYMCASRDIRERHYETLIKIYHDCLTHCLLNEGINVNKVLPWLNFIESCEDAQPWALIYVLLNQQITLINEEASEKYFTRSPELLEHVVYGAGRVELVNEQFNSTPGYRDKLTESVLEILELLPDNPPNL